MENSEKKYNDIGMNWYAVLRWCVDDIHGLREGKGLSRWTDEQAEDFLSNNENIVQGVLCEAGWESWATLMEMES